LAERGESLIGSTVFAAMEGTRPLLCEVQSLCSGSYMAMPRRTALGFDVNRVNLLAAVLDKHLDCDFARHDVFVNVVGGLKIAEPAADLAIASAMLSSIGGQALPAQTIFFGEIGLTGEIRAGSLAVERLREAEKLGFAQAVLPLGNKKHIEKELKSTKLKLQFVKHVGELSRFTGAELRHIPDPHARKAAPAKAASAATTTVRPPELP